MDFSSSSTSSSPQNKMSRNWLGNRYDPEHEDDKEATVTAAAAASEAKYTGVDSDSTLELDRIEKEHMFDKVVTPSDVGKLNRLVIPKQHAEKYFPLDSSTNEKGLLLNFEDRNGKPWRFRYSYWNSSQSYVMTKGWSRFVKDKKLDAGDIVSFLKGTGELGKDRLFIDWRQRHDALETQVTFHSRQQLQHHFSLHRSIPWSPLLMRPPPPPPPTNRNSYYGGYPSGSNVVNTGGSMGSVFYLRPVSPQMGMMGWQQQGRVAEPVAFDSVPVVQGKAAAKRLRLFGVNMDCPISESDEYGVISATTIAKGTPLSPTDFLNPNKGKTPMSLNFDVRPQHSTDLA